MINVTLIIRFLACLALTHALVIPVKRIRIIHSNGVPSLEVPSVGHQRHARLLNLPSIVLNLPPTITLVPAPASSTSSTPSPPSPSSIITTTALPEQPTSTTASVTSSGASSIPIVPSSTPSVPPPSDGAHKYVVAHHMVGNTFPYVLQDWADDIALAHAAGIDGFALNVGRDEWQPARVNDAYQAALQSGLDFKLFLSLDMASMPCSSPADAQALRNFVNAYAFHPNQLLYDSRAFVSTFAGESCAFGQGSVAEGWKTQFAKHPELQDKIYFVPAFFIDPAKFGEFSEVMDGDFNWNSGWPIKVTTPFVDALIASERAQNADDGSKILKVAGSLAVNAGSSVGDLAAGLGGLQGALSKFIGSTDSDKEHLNGLASLTSGVNARADDGGQAKKAYMAAVSPWFFTHYSPETFNKNFIFLSDQHLYSRRWESLIQTRDQLDIVQILTWNDYGESHYIGPIKGAQPNSEAWVDGMEHTAWLELTAYYASAFKTGQFPKIEKDKIFMWARTHPTQAQAPDPVGQPANFELMEDAVWAVVMTIEPSTVVLSTSETSSKSFDVPAGLTKLSVPISAGGTMKGVIQRKGKTVVELEPEGFNFQGSPKSYNFNAFVASATAK